jgi:GntR family transcriptional regulator
MEVGCSAQPPARSSRFRLQLDDSALGGRRSSRTLDADVLKRVPRYHQIAESLRQRIREGHYGAGQRLPTQRRLADEFRVTLMTLRQALEVLERDRLITRRHGLGTFVAAPSIDYDILNVRSFAGAHGVGGEGITTRFLRSLFARADPAVAKALGLRPGERVFVIERLRLVGGHPIGFQGSYLPSAIGAEVARANMGATPLRQVLAFKLGVDIVRAQETVSAVPLAAQAASDLGCRAGVPSFRSDRVSFDVGDRPVVYDRVFVPGDRFRITREITYDARAEGAQQPSEVSE